MLDDRTGEVIYSGQATPGRTADHSMNKSAADIHELDFSDLNQPGVLGPPHARFVRPREFHPEYGVKVYVSEPRRFGEDECYVTSVLKDPSGQPGELGRKQRSRNNFPISARFV